MNNDNTPATPAEPELITLSEFIRRFSLSKSSFYRMAARGEAPSVVKVGSATYIPMAAARSWMESRIVPAVTISRARP
jgi:predicted DNA-binding transcriptional regulator AlpA